MLTKKQSPIRKLLVDIGRTPLLTHAEEIKLTSDYRTGLEAKKRPESEENRAIIVKGERAREHLLKANLRLVAAIAKKSINRGLDYDELISEGTAGLVTGLERFDPSRGYKLSTYVFWWIKQSINRAIADKSRLIRLPVCTQERQAKLKKLRARFRCENGRLPTIQEVSEMSGLNINQIKLADRALVYPLSLDYKPDPDGESTLGDTVADEQEFDVGEAEAMRLVRRSLESLDYEEIVILILALGMGVRKATQQEIADVLGKSRHTIGHKQRQALKKLKHSRSLAGVNESVF